MISIRIGRFLFLKTNKFKWDIHSLKRNIAGNSKLHTMKIKEELLMEVISPTVTKLFEIFRNNGHEIRFAGGPVRDLLMDKIPADLDFATTATPTEMKEMFDVNQIRMINSGGEKHGTITARLDEENFECTTLRIDKITDGRHAEVEFIKDWELDAGRRDLTVNAMFLDIDGIVYDYFDGAKHLENGNVQFVGNCENRIKEDYLRILRYFRFYGRVARDEQSHDPQILECINSNASGLSRVSGERIWVELKKLITGRFGDHLLIKLHEYGVGDYIGFPSNFNVENITRIFHNCKSAGINTRNMQPSSLLVAGFNGQIEAQEFINRVKCSNKERDIIIFIITHRKFALAECSVKYVKDLLVDLIYKEKRNKDTAVSMVRELIMYIGNITLLEDYNNIVIPKFPITGGMLVNHVRHKKEIKGKMDKLLNIWKKSHYLLTSEELIESLNIGDD